MTDAPFAAANRAMTAATAPGGTRTRGHILVTAATGALRPAALALAARGYAVTALARTASDLAVLAQQAGPRLRPLAADFTDPALEEQLTRAEQASGPFTGALLYAPTAPAQAWRTLSARTGGPRTIRLLGCEWAEPPADRPTALPRRPPRNPPGIRTLLIGWFTEEDGKTRWHSPQELSDAALELFDAESVETQNFGEVQPWTDRP